MLRIPRQLCALIALNTFFTFQPVVYRFIYRRRCQILLLRYTLLLPLLLYEAKGLVVAPVHHFTTTFFFQVV